MELILYKACPFAQRVRIVLLHTETPHEPVFIQPGKHPAWFKDLSPMGQVPLLRLDEERSLFDSSVINEYLNEHTRAGLLPEDPFERAIHRGLIVFSGECQRAFGGLVLARNEAGFNQAWQEFSNKLNWLEKQLSPEGPYLLGKRLSLVDFAFATLFQRLEHLRSLIPCTPEEDAPRFRQRVNALLDEGLVQKALPAPIADLFRTYVRNRAPLGYFNSLMP